MGVVRTAGVMARMAVLLAVLLTPVVPVLAAGGDDEVNHLELAALMLRDGNLDRAKNALQQVDQQDEAFDAPRFHTIRGMIFLRAQEPRQARAAFEDAIAAGQTDSVVFVYLAQVNYDLENYQGVIDALDRAGAAVERVPSVYHMRAQAHWLLEQPARALAVLDQADRIFPSESSFMRRKIFYLIDLGLYQEAATLGKAYLREIDGDAEDYIAIGNALRQSGQLTEALEFLESAKLRFPGNTTVAKVLGHAYIDRGDLNAAADIIYEASKREPALASEAVELYRRAGQTYRALTLNTQLADQEQKLKQRLALLLELNQFAQAAAMEDALRRNGLLENEDILYALAYAVFKTGDYPAAERHLTRITRSDLFRKATELRKAMEDCGTETWRCI